MIEVTSPSEQRPGVHLQDQELLERLADGAESRPEWSEFVAYCRERIRGLRQPAFAHLDAFIEQAQQWSAADRRAFTVWLCEQLEQHARPHGQLPNPLARQVLMPALRQWISEDASAARPHRWLARFFDQELYRDNDYSQVDDPVDFHLRAALAADPTEQPARVQLIEKLVGLIDFATHHLPEGYIGDPEFALAKADEADAFNAGIVDPELRAELADLIAYWRGLVLDWIEFTEAGGDDFAAWCQARGRDYAWSRTYYIHEQS